MSTATDFLNGWVQENVNATVYEDTQTAEHLANDCLWEATEYGITEAELMEAVNRAVDHAVEDRG
jgi:hypothetical protein